MKLLKQIDSLFRAGTAAGLTDGELLERFLKRKEETAEAAFAALVDRHGAMVLRICRQVLLNEHDAEEAAQATFFVLARRAGSIRRRDSIASWLHGVALRVAAKARVAAARRRAHERRGGEIMTARHVVQANEGAFEDREHWDLLHKELGRLPESFRSALVLCDLEGSTQEQAAAQLRCPLGTVQSRLARGRAKLKARLQRRGLKLSAFGGAGQAQQSVPPPPAWAEATVNMAMRFAHKGTLETASAASAALAEEAIRTMVLTKMTILATGMILVGAALVSGAAVWARQARISAAAPVAIGPANQQAQPETPRQKDIPDLPEMATRTIRGTVRDEQGVPVAKAWVGSGVIPPRYEWQVVVPRDRIRERAEPFRDDRGGIIPAGALGKYYELQDEAGRWRPIHPAHIRRSDARPPSDTRPAAPFGQKLKPTVPAAVDNEEAGFEVAEKGRWEMVRESFKGGPADRTDPQGRFAVESSLVTRFGHELHFASPDFSRQAVHTFRADDPNEPVEITVRAVRPVRARVVVTPKDAPNVSVEWTVYAAGSAERMRDGIRLQREDGVHWCTGVADTFDPNSLRGLDRRFDSSLPPGQYKVNFGSDLLLRTIEFEIPPGNGPFDLPDIRLDTLGWVTMLSKPAPEITAVDLDQQPVKLADYRGRMVVVAFWTSTNEHGQPSIHRLKQIQRRFKDQPVAILAIHDASLTRPEELKKVLAPLAQPVAGEPQIRFLLDRPVGGDARGTSPQVRAGEHGTGVTAAAYEVWNDATTLVIDKTGVLSRTIVESIPFISTYELGKDGALVCNPVDATYGDGELERSSSSLIAALDSTLGLPSSRVADSKALAGPPPFTPPPAVAKGKVLDLNGHPISGAKLSSFSDVKSEHAVTTGPAGEFTYKFQKGDGLFPIRVEAPGFATRGFQFRVDAEDGLNGPGPGATLIDPSGVIPQPLVLGPGVAVAGRVVKDGKPAAGVSMGLAFVDRDDSPSLSGVPQVKTDARGMFRFPHVLPETDFWIYAKVGSIEEHGALIPRRMRTTEDGSTVDLGDLHAQHGRTLAGRVVTSDGKPVLKGAVLWAWFGTVDTSVELKIDGRGQFESKGVPEGRVSLHVELGRAPAEGSYRLSALNKCRDPWFDNQLEGRLDHDITDLTILVEPDTERAQPFRSRRDVDPALVADFNDAKAGPITGVPPRP